MTRKGSIFVRGSQATWFEEAEANSVELNLFEGDPGAGRPIFPLASGSFLLPFRGCSWNTGGRWLHASEEGRKNVG